MLLAWLLVGKTTQQTTDLTDGASSLGSVLSLELAQLRLCELLLGGRLVIKQSKWSDRVSRDSPVTRRFGSCDREIPVPVPVPVHHHNERSEKRDARQQR
jgi:hypothetical protein